MTEHTSESADARDEPRVGPAPNSVILQIPTAMGTESQPSRPGPPPQDPPKPILAAGKMLAGYDGRQRNPAWKVGIVKFTLGATMSARARIASAKLSFRIPFAAPVGSAQSGATLKISAVGSAVLGLSESDESADATAQVKYEHVPTIHQDVDLPVEYNVEVAELLRPLLARGATAVTFRLEIVIRQFIVLIYEPSEFDMAPVKPQLRLAIDPPVDTAGQTA